MEITPAVILAHVATDYGYSVDDLTGPRRFRHLCQARHLAMRLIRQECGLSYAQLGLFFNQAPKTVMYGCRRAATEASRASFEKQHSPS